VERIEPASGIEVALAVTPERIGGIRASRPVAIKRGDPVGGVGVARGVGKQRMDSARSVIATSGVAKERIDSAGSVGVANGIAKQRIDSGGRVEAARAVAKERIDSDSGVLAARGVILKRTCPQTGVVLLCRSNPRQTERENERNIKDGEKPSRRMAKHIIPSLFVELVSSTRSPNSKTTGVSVPFYPGVAGCQPTQLMQKGERMKISIFLRRRATKA